MIPKLCIIGDPVEQSMSPVIQTAMMKALGVEGSYERVRVAREQLPGFLERARAGEYTGFNATMPLKTDLARLLDELDPSARAVEAVNAVVRQPDGRLVGYNTDGDGFVEAMRIRLGVDSQGGKTALLGTGGAARAVSAALARSAPSELHVCGRSRLKVDRICECVYHAAGGQLSAAPHLFDPVSLFSACENASVLVNCTNLGMAGRDQFQSFDFLDALPPDAAVCDVVYHPAETELLRRARAKGLKTMNGIPMLVWQGVLALEKFLGGQRVNREKMALAAYKALGAEGLS